MAPDAGADANTGAAVDTDTTDPGTTAGERCPVCEVAYDSVSVHGTGLMINLQNDERYRRVCLEPVDEDGPRIRFYHHTHEQTALSE